MDTKVMPTHDPLDVVVPMTDEELKRRYDEIRLTKKDYLFGELFTEAEARSRTQEDVAKAIGLSQRHVSYLLNFGRFCRFILEDRTAVLNAETARFVLLRTPERLFRKFWTETKATGNTVQRYRAVYTKLETLRLSADTAHGKYDSLAKKIKAQGFINGKRVRLDVLVSAIAEDMDLVVGFFDSVRKQPRYGMTMEWLDRRKAVRLHPTGKRRIDATVLLSQVREYLDELEEMRSFHPARLSTARISELAILIRRAFDAAMQ